MTLIARRDLTDQRSEFVVVNKAIENDRWFGDHLKGITRDYRIDMKFL